MIDILKSKSEEEINELPELARFSHFFKRKLRKIYDNKLAFILSEKALRKLARDSETENIKIKIAVTPCINKGLTETIEFIVFSIKDYYDYASLDMGYQSRLENLKSSKQPKIYKFQITR